MKIIGINDWTLGAACAENSEENKQELLKATLSVMRIYGDTLKTVEWFGSSTSCGASENQAEKAA